jgi:benzylsuccinate CoA-transferase BbsF subunit
MGVLDGLRVVELSIAIAAPSCCRALAFHGAEVVKVESRTNPDVARLFGSAWAAGIAAGPYMDTSPYVAEMSANKRSVGLELKRPEAREALLALIATADVFVTNYSTPAVRGLGLGPDDLLARNPGLVYVALPGFGSDPRQPYYEFLAWGPNQAPLVGLDELTGYPDQVPAGIATIAPPDYFAGLHALAAVLTALEHRDDTGEGTVVDIAQFETTVSSLGPFLLDHVLSGPSRRGRAAGSRGSRRRAATAAPATTHGSP